MSLRYEQYNALKRSKELLTNMLQPGFKKHTAKKIREMAYDCLRHFPMLTEQGQPKFSQDKFTKDD